MGLVQDALAGDRRALARVISLVENGGPEGRAALAALHPHTGRAHVVGVTGGPGTGKSTLVNALAGVVRQRGITVGVLAVDPSSPFSGGALLGDRVRMRDLAGDAGVFIRSMATRGSLGGLAQATSDAVKVLDAAGFGLILVETVGAGQSELAIAGAAHTVVVVEAPGLGDEVQALKAGLLEIADILVVNKADLPGAAQAARALGMAADRGGAAGEAGKGGWRTPVLLTAALDGAGVPEVADAVVAHGEHLRARGMWAAHERERARAEFVDHLQRESFARLMAKVGQERVEGWVTRSATREVDAHTAARTVLSLGLACGEADVEREHSSSEGSDYF